VLIVSQPAPGQLTDGIVGAAVAAVAARPVLVAWLRGFGNGIPRATDDALAARALADRLADADDAVADVVKGPLSSEQPLDEHPVAAGPTKVGGPWPRLAVVTPLG
jgi:hypothetical protein